MEPLTHRPSHQYPTVRQYMTAMPCTIGREASLAAARKSMLAHSIRHLPVLDGGKIVGLLSERDLLLVETLPGVDPAAVRVEEAMVASPFVVSPDTSVADVVQWMVDRKVGSAIVGEWERAMGVFTTIDALRALSDLLAADR
jgi:acetoin utilization protein AcuB